MAISNKVKRNVCLAMLLCQTACTIAYAADMVMGGDTEWWRMLSATVIAFALLKLYFEFRTRVRKGILFGK